MLIEMYSPVFKKNEIVRSPIKFKAGLNVIQGSDTGANSIGKSSALLAIDFVYGGKSYLDSDGVKHLGNHTIYFAYSFDKKYYFARSTEDPDKVYICNENYVISNEYYDKKTFQNFLMEKYMISNTEMSFRQLIGLFFRIYGKENIDENYPLQGYRGQNNQDSIKILMSLFDYYKDIESYHNKLNEETDKLNTFKKARKYSFISNLVGGKTQYEENITLIKSLEAELDSLIEVSCKDTSKEDIEQNKIISNLRSKKYELETNLESLKRKSKLLDISIEFGIYPTESDINLLAEYFPEVNIKKIYEIENFHKQLSDILINEFKCEKNDVNESIFKTENEVNKINNELNTINVSHTFSKEFLDKYSGLEGEIKALKKQNEAFIEENRLKDSKTEAKERLERNVSKILTEIQFKINNKMYEYNNMLYTEPRNSPKIHLLNYNNYKFYTPSDTGTGTNFKGLILFDLAVLYLSSLPALAHDSLIFKNIDDEGVNGIMKIYNNFSYSNKQIFIAFDKQSSYSEDTCKILKNNVVLQLGSNGSELYGESWNKEIKSNS